MVLGPGSTEGLCRGQEAPHVWSPVGPIQPNQGAYPSLRCLTIRSGGSRVTAWFQWWREANRSLGTAAKNYSWRKRGLLSCSGWKRFTSTCLVDISPSCRTTSPSNISLEGLFNPMAAEEFFTLMYLMKSLCRVGLHMLRREVLPVVHGDTPALAGPILCWTLGPWTHNLVEKYCTLTRTCISTNVKPAIAQHHVQYMIVRLPYSIIACARSAWLQWLYLTWIASCVGSWTIIFGHVIGSYNGGSPACTTSTSGYNRSTVHTQTSSISLVALT